MERAETDANVRIGPLAHSRRRLHLPAGHSEPPADRRSDGRCAPLGLDVRCLDDGHSDCSLPELERFAEPQDPFAPAAADVPAAQVGVGLQWISHGKLLGECRRISA
jgi:hypothetical protein